MSNTASDVWADSAYRSQEIEEKLSRRGLKSRIAGPTVIASSARRKRWPTRRAPRCVRASNTSSAIKRTAWESSRPHHRHCSRAMQDRNDEPRLQYAALHLSRKDVNGGRVNRRDCRDDSVSGLRKSSAAGAGDGFKSPQSEAGAKNRPCRALSRRSITRKRIFFEVLSNLPVPKSPPWVDRA